MKKIYFILLSLTFLSHLKAQPIITQANYPSAGESYAAVAYLSATWTPGLSGAGQTWDFSTLANPTNLTFDYVAPSSTPYSASFSSSDIALNVIGQYSFFITSPTAYQVSGTVTSFPSAVVRPYSDPQQIITFPFTYTDSFKDTARTLNYSFGSDQQRRVIYAETEADAYGTVVVPGGTIYNNTLRIRTTAKTIDSTFNSGGTFLSEDISIDTNYYWISPDYKPHVFVLTKSIQNGGSPTVLAQYFSSPSLLTGTKGYYNSYFSVYPNPFSSELFIEVDENLFKSKPGLQIHLLNSTGLEVGNYLMTSAATRIPRNGLAVGMYFYKIESEGTILAAGKLTIQ